MISSSPYENFQKEREPKKKVNKNISNTVQINNRENQESKNLD